jgi:hypothetical protein
MCIQWTVHRWELGAHEVMRAHLHRPLGTLIIVVKLRTPWAFKPYTKCSLHPAFHSTRNDLPKISYCIWMAHSEAEFAGSSHLCLSVLPHYNNA